MHIVTNSFEHQTLAQHINNFASNVTRFRAAIAFFTSAEFVEDFAKHPNCTVHLIVSLNPPTSYRALRELLWRTNIRIDFIASGLHSKIYLLENSANQRLAVIGSSNLTNGGLIGNIETNVIFRNEEVDFHDIDSHFNYIVERSSALTPEILEQYRDEYESFVAANSQRRTSTSPPAVLARPASTIASSFLHFWRSVNYVRELVHDLSADSFPELPVYAAIDHFWHYLISIEGHSAVSGEIQKRGRDQAIRDLFSKYAEWDLGGDQYWKVLMDKVRLVQNLLSSARILDLKMTEAIAIYQSLHANETAIKRFGTDAKFSSANSIESVIRTFSVLLHSSESVENRIGLALSAYKLKHFGPSCVQELNGWFHPNMFPVRNTLADQGVQLLQISPTHG